MAAATLERVRISASELRDMLASCDRPGGSDNMREMKEPRQRRDNRRPDIEIYKPGLSRLRNKPKLDTSVSEGNHSEEYRSEETECSVRNGVSPPVISEDHSQVDDALEQNGPVSEITQGQESSFVKDDSDRKIAKRTKKPDRLIYQPGRRLKASVKESLSETTEEDYVNKTEQLKIVDEEECEKSIPRDSVNTKLANHNVSQDGASKSSKSEKGKRPERDRSTKPGEDMSLGRPGKDERKSGSTKRYSHSDKRRTRTRTCSTSSAGSNNSSEEAPLAEGNKKRHDKGKPIGDRKEKIRFKKQVSISSTDSFEEDGSEWSEGPFPSRNHEKKRQNPTDKGWVAKADRERRLSSRESRGVAFQVESTHRGISDEERIKRRGERVTYPLNTDIEREEVREMSAEPRGRGRGILILPANTDLSSSAAGSLETKHSSTKLLFTSAGSKGVRGRGRGGASRRLWDPNNPEQKPALKNQSPPLHFLDTDDEAAPSSQGDAYQPLPQTSYYKFQNSDNPYYYPHPQYPYCGGFSMPYAIGPSNGMYPGAYYPGYPAQTAQYGSASYSGSTMTPEEVEQQVRSLQQQELSRLLRLADNQEVQLSNLLSRDGISPEGLNKMALVRSELFQLYERCLLMDIEFCDQHNVDQVLWKSVFYQVIEKFRHFLKDPSPDSEDIRRKLLQVLDEGTAFFDSLLQKLQGTYQFKMEDYMDGMAIRSKPLRKTVKFALISAQRCMICQGDIARYREQATDTSNYGKARSWYLKAKHIAPKNGRPYNQLALLAIYTRRKLDAVYYYMRSLAASNPILTAKESLMSLFEETKRKSEQMEQKQQKDTGLNPQGPGMGTTFRHTTENTTRLEIWIHPTRGGCPKKDAKGYGGLDSVSPSDLNKRFLLSFLHAQGKLFTRIGMETFPAVAEKVMKEFQTLLQHSPSPVGSTRMLQIMAINMFAVYNSQLKG
ncbi:hypothetical protein FKM82_008522, partial [Ascaphus truei]